MGVSSVLTSEKLKREIDRQLKTEDLCVEVYPSVASTNLLVCDRAEKGGGEGLVIIAQTQTDGRGRRGRSFCSPDKTGLYMSILLRPTMTAETSLSVTTAAAVAVCRAIERVSSQTAEIKWVNDVFCSGKKVCGILTQASFAQSGDKLSYVVLGIGINVSAPKGGFPKEIENIAASVFDDDRDHRAETAAAVLDEFFALYRTLENGAFVQEYRDRSLIVGRDITVVTPVGERRATALSVDEQCRLHVRYESGEEATLSSGDVSIRV